jgi:hypothetical protein
MPHWPFAEGGLRCQRGQLLERRAALNVEDDVAEDIHLFGVGRQPAVRRLGDVAFDFGRRQTVRALAEEPAVADLVAFQARSPVPQCASSVCTRTLLTCGPCAVESASVVIHRPRRGVTMPEVGLHGQLRNLDRLRHVAAVMGQLGVVTACNSSDLL